MVDPDRNRPGGAGSATPWQGTPAGGVEVFYLHPDHLDTPRVLVNAANQPVWRWDSAPFGDTDAVEQPTAGLPSFAFSLRFPGQQYDQETGTHYNYFRDYEPGVGRYVQSDPVGLLGGINGFGYVGQAPLTWVDPYGLRRWCAMVPVKKSITENGKYWGEYDGFVQHCYERPNPQPADSCAHGKCLPCFEKCSLMYSILFPFDLMDTAAQVGGLGAGYYAGTSGAAASFSAASVCASAAGIFSAGILGLEIGTAARCFWICSFDPDYYKNTAVY